MFKSALLKKLGIKFFRYFFLALFLGFFSSNTFFDHTHICDGNIIVHSHPFRHDRDGKPLHSHTDSEYLLIHLLNNYIANGVFSIFLLSTVLVLLREINKATIKKFPTGVRYSLNLLRGPPGPVHK